MTITTKDFAEALFLALQEAKEEDHDRIIDNLISELKMSDRLGEFEEIISELEIIFASDDSLKKAEVTLSRVAAANQRIVDELNQVFKNQVTIKPDDSIVGGAVIRVDDTLVDGSVRERLSKLQKELAE